MHDPTDPELIHDSIAGNQQAFATLVGRYAQPLVAVIRTRTQDAGYAEDVWQETLLAAWTDLAPLRDPSSIRPWLMQVARNQCSAGRRASGRAALETIANARPADRSILKAFYIEGFTIGEIAARQRLPTGTVKRRLHTARQQLRRTQPQASDPGRRKMDTPPQSMTGAPFPARRPTIEIVPVAAEAPTLDCRELRWWYIVPALGDQVSGWRLSTVTTDAKPCARSSKSASGATGAR